MGTVSAIKAHAGMPEVPTFIMREQPVKAAWNNHAHLFLELLSDSRGRISSRPRFDSDGSITLVRIPNIHQARGGRNTTSYGSWIGAHGYAAPRSEVG